MEPGADALPRRGAHLASAQPVDGAWLGALERDVARRFRLAARGEPDMPADGWRALCLAQAHGDPTRLLDETYNPPVAAFFALSDRSPDDAVILGAEASSGRELLTKAIIPGQRRTASAGSSRARG
ncbi:hypothetical protein BE21_37275 [Sorangium cellulosum]|uniref:FRG domain-containing protein n=1 Tax=Sorangium cellulosum TaxID=56 RepID=A0A150TMW9_SORCE|nr:hypothetical protein BE21_37275 [Sorangium cellulosum]